MAWTYIDPNTYGEEDVYKRLQHSAIMANSIGTTMDGYIEIAEALNGDLSNAIEDIRDSVLALLGDLGVDFAAPGLDTTTTFTAPTAPTIGSLPTTPTAPAIGSVLDTAAYSGAFALARDAALAVENADLWAAETGAAANGIGMPQASMLAVQSQVRQKKRQAVSEAALSQATLQATHLREDIRWSYEQRIAYYRDTASVIVETFKGEIEGYQAKLSAEAGKQTWKAEQNVTELRRAELASEYASRIQDLASRLALQAQTAFAAALAEQFKAWLSAASYSLGASTTVDGLTTTVQNPL
jgi:hypothetical protein